MRTISILFAVLLLVGCNWTDHVDVRFNIPAQSISGVCYADYALYIDDVESVSSKESRLDLSSDNENNSIKFLLFDTHLYDGVNYIGKYKVIPSPGDLYRVVSTTPMTIPVGGVPYDVNFEGEFTGEVRFYGNNEETMYQDIKTVPDVQVFIKGWMKEKVYYSGDGFASYDCDLTMEFTVGNVDYKIVITETCSIYHAGFWFD